MTKVTNTIVRGQHGLTIGIRNTMSFTVIRRRNDSSAVLHQWWIYRDRPSTPIHPRRVTYLEPCGQWSGQDILLFRFYRTFPTSYETIGERETQMHEDQYCSVREESFNTNIGPVRWCFDCVCFDCSWPERDAGNIMFPQFCAHVGSHAIALQVFHGI